MRKLLLCVATGAGLLFHTMLPAQTVCTSSRNGNAANAMTWGGTPPSTCTDFVVNHLVVITGTLSLTGGTITVNGPDGLLLMGAGGSLSLTNSTLILNNSTFLVLGTLNLDNSPLFINGPLGSLSGTGTVNAGDSTYMGSADFLVITQAGGLDASGALLPIELTVFTGKQVGQEIQLYWQTATERDNDYMEVQRSRDGKRFDETLGRVSGAGNSATTQHYTFTDMRPWPGVNYYRLRQVDFDGQEAFHVIIAVRFEDKNAQLTGISVFPTVVRESFYIDFPQETTAAGAVSIVNFMGQVLRRESFGAGVRRLQLSAFDLPAGHYVIITETERTRAIARLVKE